MSFCEYCLFCIYPSFTIIPCLAWIYLLSFFDHVSSTPFYACTILGHLDDFNLEAEFGTHGSIRRMSGGQKVIDRTDLYIDHPLLHPLILLNLNKLLKIDISYLRSLLPSLLPMSDVTFSITSSILISFNL